MIAIKTIDAHAAGGPLRLVVAGFPAPRGATMREKHESATRHADHLRRALMLEPRGHADMYGAVLTEPVSPSSHAGVLFMHNQGYAAMCGHGIIAVTTIALERGLLMPGGDGATIVYDTAVGAIRASATSRARGDVALRTAQSPANEVLARGGAPPRDGQDCREVRVERVSFVNVPAFVLQGGLVVKVGARHVGVDVAFGGTFYAIVDSEAVGVPIDGAHFAELRRIGMEIKRAVDAACSVVHPLDPRQRGIYGTIFTGPPNDPRGDLRNATVYADASIDRSPCGTGTAAVMAVLDAMGLIDDDRPFVHESLIGTTFSGRIVARTSVGDHAAVVTQIEGSAWITGDHTFLVDDDDPFRDGILL